MLLDKIILIIFTQLTFINQFSVKVSLSVLVLTLTFLYSCSTSSIESKTTTPTQYTLTVIAGEGGTVSPEASGSYNEGAQLTLTATPDPGYVFCRWLGTDNDQLNCAQRTPPLGSLGSRCIIKMNANREVQAFFEKKSK